MFKTVLCGALGAAACLLASTPGEAHVTLERGTSPPDATYRAVLQINHGCGGAATTGVTVTIPEGVIAAHPMAKPGWTLAIDKGPYTRSYRLYGEDLASGPKTISWTGGHIPDDQYDEFVVMARVTSAFAPGSTVYFPVVQQCGENASRWVEIPASGQDAHALRNPAPGVRIVSAASLAQTTPPTSPMPEHDMSMHAAGGTPPAIGSPIKAGALTITAPWMRATPGGAKVAGGYVRIANDGDAPDRLVAASIPLAARGEVHQMSMDGGVMKMAPVEGGLVVPAHGVVELKPGGYHLMFMDLGDGVKVGQAIRGRLVFERAGPVDVTFQVGSLGAQTAPSQN